MRQYDSDPQERTDLELTERDARALTEAMTVLREAPDVFLVSTESGSEYTVDTRDGVCSCPDFQRRKPEGGCKHIRRVDYATGETPIPAWVDIDAVDPLLGRHTDATPRVAATDGGQSLAADATGIEDHDTDRRPDDCGCWDPNQSLPCWPCWRDGFETPNPNVDADDE